MNPVAAAFLHALMILLPLLACRPAAADEAWARALAARDVAAIERLLELGAAADAEGANGKTALMVAAQAGELPLVRRLLSAGADVNARNANGGSPLMYAAAGGHAEITRLLISRGAEVSTRARLGWTPLLVAAATGHTEAVRVLLDAGADVDCRDAYGWTPLMRAVSGSDADTVRVLLTEGKPDLEAAEENGATALHIAAGEGQVELVRLLLAAGADPAARDGDGRTPADVAAEANHAAAAALLQGA